MGRKINYKPDIAIHPGITLEENILFIGMSQKELADRTNLTPKTINEIIKEKGAITPETAIKLERVLGIPATFWNNLEKNYQETRARLVAEKQLAEEKDLARKFMCFNELARWGILKKANNLEERVNQLLNFFGVASLNIVRETEAIAFRQTKQKNVLEESLAAWLRWGELEARNIEVERFNRRKVYDSIPRLRSLTTEEPKIFGKEMRTVCSSCGIAVVFTPYLKRTYVYGATKWFDDKALIQLSLRFKYLDIFWFTFFHELGHILLHGKKEEFIEFKKQDYSIQKEREADDFAQRLLIPPKEYTEFLKRKYFTTEAIENFATHLGIHKAIVAGRLARDSKIHWKNVSYLRPRLEFVKD